MSTNISEQIIIVSNINYLKIHQIILYNVNDEKIVLNNIMNNNNDGHHSSQYTEISIFFFFLPKQI